MSGDARAAAYRRLSNCRPSGVSVVFADGSTREIALGRGKLKWEKALAIAEQLGGVGLELRDAAGGILEVVPLVEPQPADELTVIGDPEAVRLHQLLQVALAAADKAVARQQEGFALVTEAATSLMNATAQRAVVLENTLVNVLNQVTKLHAAMLEQAAAAVGGQGDSNDQIAGMLVSRLVGSVGEDDPPKVPTHRKNGKATEDA